MQLFVWPKPAYYRPGKTYYPAMWLGRDLYYFPNIAMSSSNAAIDRAALIIMDQLSKPQPKGLSDLNCFRVIEFGTRDVYPNPLSIGALVPQPDHPDA